MKMRNLLAFALCLTFGIGSGSLYPSASETAPPSVFKCSPISNEVTRFSVFIHASDFADGGDGTAQNPFQLNVERLNQAMHSVDPSQHIFVDGGCQQYNLTTEEVFTLRSNSTTTRFIIRTVPRRRVAVMVSPSVNSTVITGNTFDFSEQLER